MSIFTNLKIVIEDLEKSNQREIQRTCVIISDNCGEYGLKYKETLEYACLMRDYRVRVFIRSVYKNILKLW
jgi:hypothetical protein